MRLAYVSFRKNALHFSEKKLTFNFSKVGPANLHMKRHRHALTADTALHRAAADRVHAARSKSVKSVGYFVLMAEDSLGKHEIRVFLRKTNFQIFEIRPVHLHMAPHRHALTANTALRCRRADKAKPACSKRITSERCFVQVARVDIAKIEL